MSWFRSATHSAVLNVSANVGIHSFLVVASRKQFECLCSSRVTSRRIVVVLLEDLYTKVFGLRDVNLVMVVEKSFSYYALCELKKRMSSFLLFDCLYNGLYVLVL
jgi:hypothetical protein